MFNFRVILFCSIYANCRKDFDLARSKSSSGSEADLSLMSAASANKPSSIQAKKGPPARPDDDPLQPVATAVPPVKVVPAQLSSQQQPVIPSLEDQGRWKLDNHKHAVPDTHRDRIGDYVNEIRQDLGKLKEVVVG